MNEHCSILSCMSHQLLCCAVDSMLSSLFRTNIKLTLTHLALVVHMNCFFFVVCALRSGDKTELHSTITLENLQTMKLGYMEMHAYIDMCDSAELCICSRERHCEMPVGVAPQLHLATTRDIERKRRVGTKKPSNIV